MFYSNRGYPDYYRIFMFLIMPYKNKMKQLAEGAFYHAYNRGYHKQQIFIDDHDYHTFIYLLRKYLDPDFRETKLLPNGEAVRISINKPLYNKVEVHAYCLMPNHFHLLVRQITKDGMPRLINIINSQYSSYFNQKYGRSDTIWHGTYKAVIVKSEEQYLHLSRYIHLNPMKIIGVTPMRIDSLSTYPYSSYPVFLGLKKSRWIKQEDILHYFTSKYNKTAISYKRFIEGYYGREEKTREKELDFIRDLIIEDEGL